MMQRAGINFIVRASGDDQEAFLPHSVHASKRKDSIVSLCSAGKWNKHVDAWDCLEKQDFLSLEGIAFVLRQMFQVSKPPNRPTPEFMVLKKYNDWEIRR